MPYNELAEMTLGALSPEPMLSEHEADHSHAPSAEVNNAGVTRCFAFGEIVASETFVCVCGAEATVRAV